MDQIEGGAREAEKQSLQTDRGKGSQAAGAWASLAANVSSKGRASSQIQAKSPVARL